MARDQNPVGTALISTNDAFNVMTSSRRQSKLMDTRRDHILQRYGVAPDARLRSGMEAEVYAYGADAVLKLYPGTASLADLMSLRDFYAGLERQHMPYALPRIRTVAQAAGILITVEQRLAGTPLSTLLPGLTTSQLEAVMQRYLT